MAHTVRPPLATPRAREVDGAGPGRLALVVLALLAAAGLNGWIIVVSPAGPLADLTHYKHWTRLVTVDGMHAAYGGEYPETYAIYPPVTLLTFRAAGRCTSSGRTQASTSTARWRATSSAYSCGCRRCCSICWSGWACWR